MEESKKRMLEEKLRQMLMSEDQAAGNQSPVENRLIGAVVIRRRKGVSGRSDFLKRHPCRDAADAGAALLTFQPKGGFR